MKKVVIKIGTSTITKEGVKKIVENITEIRNGFDLALVSSGAVGYGKKYMDKNFGKHKLYPKELSAIGQGELFSDYRKYFEKRNVPIAQILVTKSIYKTTLNRLMKHGITPILNGNDPDDPRDLLYDDNDSLAGDVAMGIKAKLLVIVTDIDGVYDKNPRDNNDARKYKIINKVTNDMLKNSQKTGSSQGTGGMRTKLLTAKKLLEYNISTYITSSFKDVEKFLSNADIKKQDFRGTFITKTF